MSGGTTASLAGVMLAPSFAFRDGRIVTERGAKRVRTFDVRRQAAQRRLDRQLGALRPAPHPQLAARGRRLPRLVRPGVARDAGRVADAARCPGCAPARGSSSRRFVKGSTGGPDEADALAQRIADRRGGLRRRRQRARPASSSPARTATRSPGTSWPGAPSAPSSRGCPAAERSVQPRRSGCASWRPAASNWAWLAGENGRPGARRRLTPSTRPRRLLSLGLPGKGGGPNLSDSFFGTLEVSGH